MPKSRKPESLVDGLVREAAEDAARDAQRRRTLAATRLRDANAILTQRVAELEREIAEQQHLLDAIAHLEANPLDPFEISATETTSRLHEATAVLVLSDLHLEETVDPAEVNGLNEFDLEIAAERMDRLAIGLVWLLEMCRSQYTIRELFLPCLGDVTTNYLRPEDIHGNGLAPFEGLVFAEQQLVRFVQTVLARAPWIERVFMPIVPGNHDRLAFTKSTPFRKRIGMSSAPVLAHGIAREMRDEPRFRVELATSEHHYTMIYSHRIRGMHGDRFNYQGGVGGIFIPARRHIAQLNKAIPAALTLFGHWHTSKSDDLWVSNGSLIGPNAYSIAKGLDPEPPAQTFLLLDRDRGKRIVTPVQVSDKDGWS